MLKVGIDHFTAPLAFIFNLVLVHEKYPSNWCEGLITTIFKSGDPGNPENYRGITLCSNLSKLYSSILNKRLDQFLIDRGLNSMEQIGFKKKARTADHIFVLKSLLDLFANKGNKIYACFVDFRKAFDCIWWNGLFFKLLKNGIRGKFYQTIRNMYDKVSSSVKTSSGLTPPFLMSQGVKQGEVLSPALFSLYVNDLPQALNSEDPNESYILGSTKLSCLMYADDLVLLAKTKDGLQNHLIKLQDYCTKWKLKVNITKTKIIIFNKQGKFISEQITLNGIPVECVKSYKYLGIDFSNSGSFKLAQTNLKIRARKASFKLRSFLDPQKVEPKVAKSLFNTLIRPIATYGSEIWGTDFPSNDPSKLYNHFYKLEAETVATSFVRSTLGTHKKATTAALYGDFGFYPLAVHAIKASIKYINHLNESNKNSLLYKCWQHIKIMKNQNTWYSRLQKICLCLSSNMDKSVKIIMSDLDNFFHSQWQTYINRPSGKLRSYCLFKDKFGYENYLSDVKNHLHRKALCQLRSSSHQLMIEKGRYARPVIPPPDRKCQTCNVVEDEIHFMLTCKMYEKQREILFKEVLLTCPNFNALDDNQKCVYLMSSEGLIIREVARFCFSSFEVRQQLVKNT